MFKHKKSYTTVSRTSKADGSPESLTVRTEIILDRVASGSDVSFSRTKTPWGDFVITTINVPEKKKGD